MAVGLDDLDPVRPAGRRFPTLGGLPAWLVWACLAGVSGCSPADAPETADPDEEPPTPVAAPRTVGDLTPFQTRKAETLLRDRLSCLGCHTLDGAGGTVGPELSEVGSRLDRSGIQDAVATPPPGSVMPPIPMPERWRSLVVSYLAGRVGAQGPAEAPESSGPVADSGSDTASATAGRAPQSLTDDGEALYRRYCAVCHGATGDGDGPNAANLPVPPTAHSDPEYMSRRPDDSLFDAIYAGGRVMNLSHRMPPFGEALTRAQIRALVDHMRTLCSCQGPDWSRDGREGA